MNSRCFGRRIVGMAPALSLILGMGITPARADDAEELKPVLVDVHAILIAARYSEGRLTDVRLCRRRV